MEELEVAARGPKSHIGVTREPTLLALVAIDQQMPRDQGEDHLAGCTHHLWRVIPNDSRHVRGIEVYSGMVRNHNRKAEPPEDRHQKECGGCEVEELDDVRLEVYQGQEKMRRRKRDLVLRLYLHSRPAGHGSSIVLRSEGGVWASVAAKHMNLVPILHQGLDGVARKVLHSIKFGRERVACQHHFHASRLRNEVPSPTIQEDEHAEALHREDANARAAYGPGPRELHQTRRGENWCGGVLPLSHSTHLPPLICPFFRHASEEEPTASYEDTETHVSNGYVQAGIHIVDCDHGQTVDRAEGCQDHYWWSIELANRWHEGESYHGNPEHRIEYGRQAPEEAHQAKALQ
mmetsp:Transcript_79648/g.191129  ORF Transcript_79648/g.191129 Transcript_79648/m.191129 type:complete len:347 (-) Transcript_79648:170-1210(-)